MEVEAVLGRSGCRCWVEVGAEDSIGSLRAKVAQAFPHLRCEVWELSLLHEGVELCSAETSRSTPQNTPLSTISLQHGDCVVAYESNHHMLRYILHSSLAECPAWARSDREVVLAAVRARCEDAAFMGTDLAHNKDFILSAVRSCPYFLLHSGEEMRDCLDVVLAAVTRFGVALRFASERLRDNRRVVIAAVSRRGSALRYASEALRSDKAVVLAAAAQDVSSVRYASPTLLHDSDITCCLATTAKRMGAPVLHSAGEDCPLTAYTTIKRQGKTLQQVLLSSG